MDNSLYVYCHDTLRAVLEKINLNSKGAVAVVDDKQSLLGLVTDGDIRRALLHDLSMNNQVTDIYQWDKFLSVDENVSYQDILALMDEKKIDQVALTDSQGRAIDLVHRRHISPILLSSPHLGDKEIEYVNKAFESNWIAPVGPNIDAFEKAICQYTGCRYAAALVSGTAALHVSLIALGVKARDIVLCSTLTFVASANAIAYTQATPVFIDSEPETWNMSPVALEKALTDYERRGIKPRAIMVVSLYGQPAKMAELMHLSIKFDVPIVEDAAESLGSFYQGRASGTFGRLGVYSFNGNKIITTSGGGMVVSNDKVLIDRIKFLSTQAKDDAPFYEHSQVGYNYKMSNVLAGIGRGQIKVLDDRVNARRAVFKRYDDALAHRGPILFAPELSNTRSNRWLSCLLLDPSKTSLTPADIIHKMAKKSIEIRHIWKPMHLQPLYKNNEYYTHYEGSSYADYLFQYGICLPSGSNLSTNEQDRVIQALSSVFDSQSFEPSRSVSANILHATDKGVQDLTLFCGRYSALHSLLISNTLSDVEYFKSESVSKQLKHALDLARQVQLIALNTAIYNAKATRCLPVEILQAKDIHFVLNNIKHSAEVLIGLLEQAIALNHAPPPFLSLQRVKEVKQELAQAFQSHFSEISKLSAYVSPLATGSDVGAGAWH